MKINLGDEVRDTVSGMQGIAISRHEYLNGCTRISVQAPFLVKEGKLPESCAFDEPSLVVVKSRKVKEGSHDTGGPSGHIPNTRPEGKR